MTRSRIEQRRHENLVDALCAIAVLAVATFAGCNYNATPPKDGDWRVLWQENAAIPRPVIVEAHVPYDGAPPESTGYVPVTP